MRITICDKRNIAVTIVQPDSGKFFNWATTGWETPFVAAAHLKPLAPIAPLPSILAAFLSADVGTTLLQSDVALLFFTVDAAGAPVEAIDVGTLPNPTANPIFGGFTR